MYSETIAKIYHGPQKVEELSGTLEKSRDRTFSADEGNINL
jgi:hypothetical protein